MSEHGVEVQRGQTVEMASFVVELPPSEVSIAVGRSVIRRLVTFVDADSESSYLVAATEILANAIDEHERIGSGKPIEMRVDYGDADTIRVIDAGEGFSADVDGGDVDESDERGRGLALARAFVDELEIASTPTGTTVTLPLAGRGIVR